MKKFVSLVVAGGLAIVAGVVTWDVLARRLTERGLAADANGTAGYTTAGDFAQAGIGVLLVVIGTGLVLYGVVRVIRGQAE